MKRPTGVTIVAVLGLVLAAVAVLESLVYLMHGGAFSAPAKVFSSGHSGAGMIGLALLAGAVLVTAACIGLLKLREWSRVLAIALNAAHLVLAALGLFEAFRHIHMTSFRQTMLSHIVMLVIGIWIIVYLLSPGVRRAFGPRSSATA
jgi:hypothetical protein